MEHALSEVERFKKQKGSDLKELFISYAVLQIKMAKRVSINCSLYRRQQCYFH